MKVIAGSAKGQNLIPLNCNKIRPTENRIKEAWFSIIQFEIANATVLDLFCGSGQLAIEALSRGAKFCRCVDSLRYASKIQKENLAKTKFLDKAEIVTSDAIKFLKKTNQQFDFVFLDPPYGLGLLVKALEQLPKNLNQNGTIICEHESGLNIPANFQNIKLQKQYHYGKINLTVFKNCE